MTSLFVDTAALIALGNKRDQFHEQALTIRKALIKSDTLLFTSNLVIAEFCNAFSALHLRSTAVQYIESIYHSTKWTVIGIDAQWFTQGFELYKKMQDKEWGLVDCTSILIAKHYNIKHIFSTDHHFEQAGLDILLKKD